MGWELKQISSQHCRAASVPEHCVGFVEEVASRKETTICLHWERGVVGREWKVEEKKDGEKKWAGFPQGCVGIGRKVAEQHLGRKLVGRKELLLWLSGFSWWRGESMRSCTTVTCVCCKLESGRGWSHGWLWEYLIVEWRNGAGKLVWAEDPSASRSAVWKLSLLSKGREGGAEAESGALAS